MGSYNLMKRADRDRMRADRMAELEAVVAGQWPRDLDDHLRWCSRPGDPAHTKKMCEAEIAYLDGVQARIEAEDPDLLGWEM